MLEIEGLRTGYTPAVPVVRELDLRVGPGETVALVGESGSGKSTVAKVLLGLLPDRAWATGSARFDGTELVGRAERDWKGLRGKGIGIVPQGAMGGLNPVHRIETQLVEAVRLHTGASSAAAKARARELVKLVHLDSYVLGAYPHQLSGGMRQRVAIGLALAGEPALLVADEPTTGLDLITQERVLALLAELRASQDLAMLVISHDLPGLLAVADRVAVMYAGRIVEHRTAAALRDHCRHPYTEGLLAATASVEPDAVWAAIPGTAPAPDADLPGCRFAPRCPLAVADCETAEPDLVADPAGGEVACIRTGGAERPGFPAVPRARATDAAEPVVRVEKVDLTFRLRRRSVPALCGVSLEIARGEILGLVGESGSGKSTLGRVLLGLLTPTAGRVLVGDTELTALRGKALRAAQRRIGFVHQDPYGSLHPAMTVRALVGEPLSLTGVPQADRIDKVREALASAGLPTGDEFLDRLPAALSGGQRQRVAIARALVADPVLLIADEATSMLDVSTRAGIATTLRRLADDHELAVLFVTHDLGEAMQSCDRVAVLREGVLLETAPPRQLAERPEHDYTAELVHIGRERATP
ncbi:oligopeptide/dipeptide ABC transporter ATP-binding protein [Actinophytocola sp. NPDC049390]|uniref:oligopeptide/dipeptide ABC transporter ATP-binding protein n=1 Tax=Actinophytocola sp. NPDC049390 TaxID=3363894 RepID=UPI0037BAF792